MRFKVILKVARMPAVWRLRVLQQFARWGIREETLLVVLSVFIGLGAGAATYGFEKTVVFITRHFFNPIVHATHCTTNWHYLWILPLIPAVGGLLLSFWRLLFRRPRTRLHGLAGVLYSLTRQAGKMHPLQAAESWGGAALTIGSGGSAGPEAPIAVIGASIGNLISNLAGISRRNLPTLIGCGAAAGISAVFAAPIAGVLFAVEVMLRDFSVRTLTPVVISSVIASTMYRALEQKHSVRGLFQMPTKGAAFVFTFHELPFYLVLGIICGLLAVLITRAFMLVEHVSWHVKKIPPFLHPAIGGCLSGVCGVALILMFRHDMFLRSRFSHAYVPIFAGGYPTILRAIDPTWYVPGHPIAGHLFMLTLGFLAAVCLLKILATAFTLGSGGSGGIFAPALFIGATGGGAVGEALALFFPHLHIQPSTYALVGMGSVLAACIQAPLMAIILLFELTQNYAVMLPIMLAAVTATVVQQLLIGESIYTLALKDLGVRLGSAVGISALRRIGVEQMRLKTAPIAGPDDPLSTILSRSQQTGAGEFVVLDQGKKYLGLLTIDDLKVVMLEPEAAPLLLVGEVLRSDLPPIKLHDTLECALEMFARHEVSHLAVVNDVNGATDLMGLLSRADLMKRYYTELGG